MKKFISGSLLAVTALATPLAINAQTNVLVIIVDDLRTDLACYGNSQIVSPNIDLLAQQGVLFNKAYSQQAVSGPSRASLLSGMRPESLEIYDLQTPLRKNHPDIVTMPQLFKENDYQTLSIGKVYHHANDDKESWTKRPLIKNPAYASEKNVARIKKLTEEAKAKGLKGKAFRVYTKGPATESANVADEVYDDGMIAKEAIDNLKRLKNSSFMMCVGFKKPHLPFVAPKKYWDMYDPAKIQRADTTKPLNMPELAGTTWGELRSYSDIPKKGTVSPEKAIELKHGYYACISYVDAQIGKLLEALDDLDLRKNTIVVLMSDHGWKLGEYGLWCKHTNFELDTHVPLIISAPKMEKGVKSNALVENVDVFPTVADLCGLKAPECDGLSMKTLLKKPKTDWKKAAYSLYPRGKVMGRSVKNHNWRYTEWTKKNGEIVATELYDHSKTDFAHENVSGQDKYKGVEEVMKGLLKK